ncbi:protein yhjK [Klebsiella pneumoniae]|uniref:Protein yhjK n=1 Tax=Klebsiella pneumoniae TaxID=573 RepID=A0A3S4HAA3_KLEPN|nr:protein yhjK [Klebsiella pneumoniae]
MLVRSYNRNQQSLVRQHDELSIQSTRFPVSELPNKAFLLAMLEQTVARPQSAALIVVACETLQDAAGVLKESQREMLLLTLVEKLRAAIPPQMVLAQVSGYDFAILADGLAEPWQAVTLSKQVLTIINERLTAAWAAAAALRQRRDRHVPRRAQRRAVLPARGVGRCHRTT